MMAPETADRICRYEAPDRCTDFEPLSCCERLGAGAPSQTQINLAVSILMIVMSVMIA